MRPGPPQSSRGPTAHHPSCPNAAGLRLPRAGAAKVQEGCGVGNGLILHLCQHGPGCRPGVTPTPAWSDPAHTVPTEARPWHWLASLTPGQGPAAERGPPSSPL